MASSTDSHSNSHAKEGALQSKPQDIHEVIHEIVQAMEGKSKEECQALLHALKSSRTQTPPEKQTTDIDKDKNAKLIPDEAEHKGERLESSNKVNDVPSLEDSGTGSVSPFDGQDQSAREDVKSATKENNVATEGQEDNHEDVNGIGKEEESKDEKDDEKNGGTDQGHGLSNKIPNIQNQIQSVSTEESKRKADKRCLEKADNNQIPDMKSIITDEKKISPKNSLTVEYRSASASDENINKLEPSGVRRGNKHDEVVESSDEDMAPSTPASGGRTSGSDLSESPNEKHADLASVNDSFSRVESTDPSTAPLTITSTSYSQPQVPDSLNQTSLNSTFERTPPSSNLHNRMQEKSPPTTDNYCSPTIKDPGVSKTSTRARHLPASTQEHSSLDIGQFYSLSGAQYPTPKISREPMKKRDCELPGSEELHTSTGIPAGFQYQDLNSAFHSTIPASSSAVRTGEQVSMSTTTTSSASNTSTVMVKPQNSLISTINTLPSMPLYYQPQIVMQDQLPVLVLRPVLAQEPASSSPQVPSSDCKAELTLESLPLIFPVGSANEVKWNIDDLQVQPKLVSDDEGADLFNKRESFAIGAELVSGYASSVTESEMDEAPLRKPPPHSYRNSARPPKPNTMYQQSHGHSPNKPFDWQFPSSNPFADKYNNTSTTDISDLKLSSSKVPTTSSKEDQFLYYKQGARSKTTNKTNPFAPEIPPRTDIEELSRNNFRSIPKSMLATTESKPRASVVQPQPKGEDTNTHRRRSSNDSMITLVEIECENEPSLDITEAVARQGNNSDNSYQSPIFEPSSRPFFGENTSFPQHDSLVAPATSPAGSIPRSQSASTMTKEEPRKTKSKLPGQVAPLWIPDDQINKCCSCHQKFNLIRRKHHCRGCGMIFCSTCCSQLARLSYLQYRIGRVCVFCTNIIKDAMRAKKAKGSPNVSETTKQASPKITGNQITGGRTQFSPSPYTPLSLTNSNVSKNSGTPTQPMNSQGRTNLSQSSGSTSQPNPQPQHVLVPSTPNYQPDCITYTDPVTGQLVKAPIVYQPQSAFPGQTVIPGQTVVPGQTVGQPGNTISQNQMQGDRIKSGDPPSQHLKSQNVSAESSIPEKTETARKLDVKDFSLPLRPAGRIVSWKNGNVSNRLMFQDRRKALAKDLKELPNGVTIQVADAFQVIVKKIKVHRPPLTPYLAWCFCSNGFDTLGHTEIVILLELKQKEDLFPEEVLRIYKVILDLVKLGNSFNHGNFIAFNSPFLGSIENAGFLFADDSFTKKLPAIYEDKTKVLYGILVKRPELEIIKHVPMRFLLRLGQETKNFPFPVVNSRDRAMVYDGIDAEDKFYHTSCAMNTYLKNIVPEALIPGLVVVKEDGKIVLQISLASQTAVVSLFDRLVVKAHQTATVPLASDLSHDIHEYKVFHQSIVTKEVSFAKSISLFRNPGVRRQSHPSVTGLGFLILHLGASSDAMMNHGGEVVDDGAVVYLSKFHTQKLRQSLYEHSNCYFYLGDRFEVVHFELRWLQNPQQPQTAQTRVLKTTHAPSNKEEFPGTATIDVRHSGHTGEIKKLASAGVGDALFFIRSIENRIKMVCMEPLMMQANKMKEGEAKELILRVSLKEGIKKWSIGPSNQPMNLIRSLQMALHAVTLTELHNARLELTFDVTIIKE